MAVQVDREKCTGCGACVKECPLEALAIENGKVVVNGDCAECGNCIEVCPNSALTL